MGEQIGEIDSLVAAMNTAGMVDQDRQSLSEPLRRVLGLRLGADLYGLDISCIREIIKLAPLTFVPGAPPYVYGVISLRGQIVPVVNLRRLLGEVVASGSVLHGVARPRIVIARQGDVLAGLLVDAATEVYDLRAELEPLPLGSTPATSRLKEGRAFVSGQVLTILSGGGLFARLSES